jgi:peptide/nickel transport system substrate-binding protein
MTSDKQFGKYRILEELGAGGFATVYKAIDTSLDREVALKLLHPALLADRRFVQSFRLEAKTLAALRHPQIITVYEVGEADDRLFIAMDLAHGLSLAQAIAERGRIPWHETLALLRPVCEALDYAHGRNVVHRDLKPANVLLGEHGALLSDFGFARLMAENSASMSLSGGIVGTPGYIAPEVWEDNAANSPVDIYALGCIVYEMVTGDVLFKGQTPIQAMRAHDRGPRFPEAWPAGVPAGIADVLGTALARDPAARYASAGALWQALNELEAQELAARHAAQIVQYWAAAERALASRDIALARKAIEGWRAVAPGDPALREAQAELGRQVRAARESAQWMEQAAQYHAEAEQATAANDLALASKAIDKWRAVAPEDAALLQAQAELERLEQAARDVAQRRALAAQYRRDAEQALAERDTEQARQAIDKWCDVAPDELALRAAQAELEPLLASPPEQNPSMPLEAKQAPTTNIPIAQDNMLSDLLIQTGPQSQATPEVSTKPTPVFRGTQRRVSAPSADRGIGSKVAAGIGGLIVLALLAIVYFNRGVLGLDTGTAPTTAPAAEAPTAAPAAEAPTAAPTAEAPAASGGSAGGTLKLLWWQAPIILNTHKAQGTKDQDASRLIIEPLAALGPDGKPVARLAAEIPSYENGGIAQDNLSITWKLQSGVKWSDGTDFTADDVVFTWQYCADPATACTTASYFAPIKTVEAINSNTVRITWKEASPNPLTAFVGFSGPVIQKAQFASCIGAAAETCPANNAPIGTGPYKLKDFKSGSTVIYEKNQLYRDADKVAFDTVEMKGGGDAVSAARAVLETGEVDYAWNLQVEPQVLDKIVAGGKGSLVVAPGPNIERILINFSNPDPALGDKRSEPDQPHPFLTDLKVRQALALALDRQLISDQGYGQAGKATCSAIAAPLDYVSSLTSCPQDVEGAKKLLAEAGWTDTNGDSIVDKDGKPMTILYQTSINAVRQKTQALIRAAWMAIGVNVQLRAIDAGVFFSNDPNNPDTAVKFFADVEMYTTGNDFPDPTNHLGIYTCANISQKSNNWTYSNANRYCNKEYDTLFEELTKTTDEAQRKELIVKLNDIVVNDVVIIPLVARSTPSAMITGLNGPTGNQWDTELWNIADWSRQ